MRDFILAIVVLFLSAGCSQIVPAVSEYRINPNVYDMNFTASGCKDKSLKVAQAFSSNALMNMDIMYGIGEHTQFRYSQSKWAHTPNAALTSEIVHFLKSTNIFSSVSVPKSRMKSDYILETNIEDFMQYFDDDMQSSMAKISISFSLIETKNNSIVTTKTIHVNVPAKTLDAEGGVVALNEALKTVMAQSGLWLEESCQ
ncbi:MAG: ABC-type transport auxiliary lipoprotein family protein [Sulfurimonas sp.]|nr:ABC-type transport auxiliary lipoprotein family protein [Sulfurimonas sp.]